MPVRPKAVLGQWLVVKACPDGLLRDDDDHLLQSLVCQLVERNEHEGAALARCGRRLDEEILLAPLLVGPFLHGPHSERIRFGRCAVAGVSDRNGRYGFDLVAHALAPALRLLPLGR